METITAVFELVQAYLLWGTVIIGGAIVGLTELSKLCKWTPSDKDDLFIASLIRELRNIKDLLLSITSRIAEWIKK